MRNVTKRIRELALKTDSFLGTDIKKRGGFIYRYLLRKWSIIRRIIDPLFIRVKYVLGGENTKTLRLHLGCGSKHFEGYINVDMWITEGTDVICDITRLPWPDNSADVIETYHVIEHISHRKIKDTLSDWFRVLKPGGRMVIEVPHLDQAVTEYLEGNESRLINIFGWQRSQGDIHLFGYNPLRLRHLLEKTGFGDFVEATPQSSQSLEEPSFRIECRKNL